MSDTTVRRRDFLVTTALTAAGVGGAAALWPLIDSMNPAADAINRRVVFDIKPLIGTQRVTINVREAPVIIFRRTDDEIAALRDTNIPNNTRDPLSPTGSGYRDSEMPNQPDFAKNWHRSLRPEVMVCVGYCTHDPCVLSRPVESEPNLLCPCCGSRYDLAGRPFSGLARENLRVPLYRFIDETTIEFPEAEVNVRG